LSRTSSACFSVSNAMKRLYVHAALPPSALGMCVRRTGSGLYLPLWMNWVFEADIRKFYDSIDVFGPPISRPGSSPVEALPPVDSLPSSPSAV
jgi:hypothetical protein